MPSKLLAPYATLALLLGISFQALAEGYYWHIQPEAYDWTESQKKHSSPELACRSLHTDTEYGEYEYYTATPTSSENQWTCNLIYGPDPNEDNLALSIHRYGDSCERNTLFNPLSGQCENQSTDEIFCISQTVGNPINFLTGYKIQIEQDLPLSTTAAKNKLKFIKYYSSVNGLWTHSYSDRTITNGKTITLVHSNGERSLFDKESGSYVARHPRAGSISKISNTWVYLAADNSTLSFDSTGRLLEFKNHETKYSITYTDKHLKITNAHGDTLEVFEDTKKQPLKVKTNNIELTYDYNKYKQLVSMTRALHDSSQIKRYLYEDDNDSRFLTGIIDERGVLYATWKYDQHGRAISSEHAQGAENVTIEYHPDNSTTVSNALGKSTTYKFGYFQGTKRIISIIGEPTANCPKSDSTFTYDERGLLTSQTDSKGITTLYAHNDRGLETSRTEASNTPESRTITTEWHDTLSLPLKIKQPKRSIQYTYDAEGRKLTQTIKTH
ncbi:RHS repeat protein [Pseudomonas fluorescens]|uniref:RHS repeat protein n=1 Tax=Pseudomonas fluorescens TaxID=294 RepID=UPI00123FAE52|nr:RHS repeat protein [Pseudomonas fluorescens]VVP87034.1 hypothetical protein PS906_03708 [Pseudomonas fluorescens]